MARLRRSRSRYPLLWERTRQAAVGFASIVAIAGLGYWIALSRSGGAMPMGPGGLRSAEERRELLLTERCAVRQDGTLMGRVVGELNPGRAYPKVRYIVESIERRQSVVVWQGEVVLKPCATLEDSDARGAN
jgi:hypothetical protein